MRSIDPFIARLLQLTKHLSHPGEKGRIAELLFVQWLTTYLPKKYSVGTGFVAATESDGQLRISPQRDIIIYDNIHVTPIWLTEISGLFPIESVYATIEIKTSIRKGNPDGPSGLYKAFRDAKIINDFAKNKSFLEQITLSDGVGFKEWQSDLPPRNYIIGYDADCSTADQMCRNICDIVSLSDFDTHCHGVLVLHPEKDWLLRRPNGNSEDAKSGIKCIVTKDSGWKIFTEELLLDLETMDLKEALFTKGLIANKLQYPIL